MLIVYRNFLKEPSTLLMLLPAKENMADPLQLKSTMEVSLATVVRYFYTNAMTKYLHHINYDIYAGVCRAYPEDSV